MDDDAETPAAKLARFQAALEQFVVRLRQDRQILAAVLVGSLQEEHMARRDSLHVWIIEADGVARRLLSDGLEVRTHRILVENGIVIYAEVIPRSRFKQMIEGASRTAFSCNFFAIRELIYSVDASIAAWFAEANQVAVKDRERELLTFSTWTIHALRHARRFLKDFPDLRLAWQECLNVAHSLAHTEIIRAGTPCEGIVIQRAAALNPALFQTVYHDLWATPPDPQTIAATLSAADDYLETHYEEHLRPLLAFLQKADRVVPLSEISEHFAYSQVYPWHLAAACEWLEERGKLEKISAPFKLTKRSSSPVEEPAYFLDSTSSSRVR